MGARFTDPKSGSKKQFEAHNKVEETRFRAMGYKQVKEKPDNKQAEKPQNKAS